MDGYSHLLWVIAFLALYRVMQDYVVSPRLMSAVYANILTRMEAAGWAPPRQRAKIGKAALLWIVLSRGLMG